MRKLYRDFTDGLLIASICWFLIIRPIVALAQHFRKHPSTR